MNQHPELLGVAMSSADHTTLARWSIFRAYRVVIAPDHDCYEEIAECYGPNDTSNLLGSTEMDQITEERLVLMVYRDRFTGEAVVTEGDGYEVGRSGDMGAALRGAMGAA